ncbi:hypothetical protein B0A52_05898 [Exophiala mesophila]|uniref:Potassium transport protein n=1 Tax=Exophiala mesophila TaxID=212818 RepID=A0A438N3S4_EXOME|nr:hypothetical protein B0A52_05898 [Exophiala mesophila]
MWKPPVTFLSLHYLYIVTCSLLSFIVIVGKGNVAAVDAFFFGASGSTESGLNTVDVKDLMLYQQIVIYVVPVVTNFAFINIIVVVVRLYWFRQRFKRRAELLTLDVFPIKKITFREDVESGADDAVRVKIDSHEEAASQPFKRVNTITFDGPSSKAPDEQALRILPPHLRDMGHPNVLVEVNNGTSGTATNKDCEIAPESSAPKLNEGKKGNALERVASSAFSIGPNSATRSRTSILRERPMPKEMLNLSTQASLGRNSRFYNLSAEDRDVLGGVEYVALKLLLRVIVAYFFGLHLLGIICILPWIHSAPAQYQDYLFEMGQSRTWWAFYSAQTMVNNLGFTLTPDSMISFRNATWPMLILTFLAFAGNTCYPIFLRLVIWLMYKFAPKRSKLIDPLSFLLEHPRRCYTLLFPSKPTWILFGILIVLNTLDVILIIALDLDNSEVTEGLPMGPRILAALFQAASSRHTGTATFNLAKVNPAVQISLLVMMYIAVFPIAMSIRSSNTYEERSLGLYTGIQDQELDEQDTRSYLVTHLQNQLSFDLWYVFLGIFCISIAESSRLSDPNDPAFSVFGIFFEVVSAYGNVGLSLGYPDVNTSLSGQFTVFSKVVICAMMIRGRHRMLPYNLDRAIMLPDERAALLTGERDGPSDVISRDTRHGTRRMGRNGEQGDYLPELKRHRTT